METIQNSAGSSPAPLNVQHLNELHRVKTCGSCPSLDRKKGIAGGYKWCRTFERYTKPEHVGC